MLSDPNPNRNPSLAITLHPQWVRQIHFPTLRVHVSYMKYVWEILSLLNGLNC